MKTVITCDSFKGSLTSIEACATIQKAIQSVSDLIETKLYPMADGGEGTAEIINNLLNGKMVPANTFDELNNEIIVDYSICDSKAIIDVASCIGIEKYIKNKGRKKKPYVGNSYGVGVLMKDAIQRGCKEILIGLGGSCTNDGGMGILNAFGANFLSKDNINLRPCLNNMDSIEKIDLSHFFFPKQVKITVLCDVTNHLLGKKGAIYVFGPQKGIPKDQLEINDKRLEKYRNLLFKETGIDINQYAGSGAAGGIGATLAGMFNAKIQEGIKTIIEISSLKDEIKNCDFVITGEGKTDDQTMNGKVPFGISQIAKEFNKPVIIISGALQDGYEQLYSFENVIGIYSTVKEITSLENAIANASSSLFNTAYTVMRTIYHLEKKS